MDNIDRPPRRETAAISAVLAPIKKKRSGAKPGEHRNPYMGAEFQGHKSHPGVLPGSVGRNPTGIGSSGHGAGPSNELLFAESLMTKAAPEIVERMIALAKDGNVSAAKLILSHVLPTGQHRRVRVPIKIPTGDNLEEFEEAGRTLMESVVDGAISPAEAVSIGKVLQHSLDAAKVSSLARRISQIESEEK
jgi:hypothetical protein